MVTDLCVLLHLFRKLFLTGVIAKENVHLPPKLQQFIASYINDSFCLCNMTD